MPWRSTYNIHSKLIVDKENYTLVHIHKTELETDAMHVCVVLVFIPSAVHARGATSSKILIKFVLRSIFT